MTHLNSSWCRTVPLLTALGVWSWSASARADYADDFAVCSDRYFAANGGTFDCNICGVDAGCTGSDCHWGSLNTTATDSSALSATLNAGFQLYCANAGGSMVASAAPVGAQGMALDRAFRGRSKDGSLSLGGLFEYANFDGDVQSYGLAAPVSWQRSFTSDDTDLDLAGALIAARSDLLTQFGVAVHPAARYFPSGNASSKTVFGLSVPVQLIATTGDAIDTSLVYHAGIGGLAGWSTSDGFGVGAAADLIYTGGFQLPMQVVGRWSTKIAGADVAFQPGLSLNPIGGGFSTLQQNLLFGWDIGSWILGARVFRIGDDGWIVGAGASSSEESRAAKLARGTSDDYARSKPGEPQPATANATPGGLTDAAVKERLAAMVQAEVYGDATGSARLRATIAQALRERSINPNIGGSALTSGPAIVDPTQANAARISARVPLAVSVYAAAQPTGSLRVVLLVTGRGVVARRELVVEPGQLEPQVLGTLRTLFARLDLRGLQDATPVYHPPPTPPPSPPTPPEPTPAPEPPEMPETPAPPDAPPTAPGCGKDTDCKGDRICKEGQCVDP
ncbi:MAG: hypothetical protein AB7S68_00450 [Polyangiaceae bacterium]